MVDQKFIYIDADCNGSDSAVILFELERNLILRARKAGFKMIFTQNTSSATQQIERDVFGYTEHFRLKPKYFKTPNGRTPFAASPSDYEITSVTLDL